LGAHSYVNMKCAWAQPRYGTHSICPSRIIPKYVTCWSVDYQGIVTNTIKQQKVYPDFPHKLDMKPKGYFSDVWHDAKHRQRC